MADSHNHSLGFFSAPVLRRLLAIFLPAAFLTAGVVLALYYQDLTKEHSLHGQSGAHLVNLQTDIIYREVDTVRSDLLYLADQAVLRNFLSGVAPSKHELEEEYVLLCRQRGLYDQIRYLDANGQERIRVNYNDGHPAIVPERELQSKANRYYFTQTMSLHPGAVFVSPFDLNVERDEIERPLKPVIRFATSVMLDKKKQGVLVLNYMGQLLIQKLDEMSAGFHGESWLLNRDGFFLRGPSDEDEWGFMLGHDRRFATYYPDEWSTLTSSSLGQLQTDHGLFSFRTIFPRGQVLAKLQATADRKDPDLGDAGLIVVTHIPPSVLNGRADLLLRRLLLLSAVVLLVLLTLAWYLAKAAALRRNQERHLAESEVRLRKLSTQLITAQEDERRRLSRDLHDELGQVITSVTLELERAAHSPEAAKKDELIQRALHDANCLLDKIHEISVRIRPTLLDDLGLKDAVQCLLSDFEQSTGIAVRAELHLDESKLPVPVSENIYRILQEALTNVAKHAHSKDVSIKLAVASGRVSLRVQDTGVGFSPDRVNGQGLGLLGMRERAELLDGDFHMQSETDKGTEIQVSIPLKGFSIHSASNLAEANANAKAEGDRP
jgi:signal transduction histidine kinase